MKTVVIGASPNPGRYSNMAVDLLREFDHETIGLGLRAGTIRDVDIITEWPQTIPDVDTVTLYLNPTNQKPHYDLILGYKPRRIIFNPGTENPEIMALARERGIIVEAACTLVLLRLGNY